MCERKYLPLILAAILGIVLHISIQITFVNGMSMAPTLRDRQMMLVNKLEHDYQTDDIIIFRTQDYGVCVKRIIAKADDTVRMKDGRIYVNEVQCSPFTCETSKDETIQLQNGEYFVIGDNYNNSIDSREYGAIRSENVIGKVICH